MGSIVLSRNLGKELPQLAA